MIHLAVLEVTIPPAGQPVATVAAPHAAVGELTATMAETATRTDGARPVHGELLKLARFLRSARPN